MKNYDQGYCALKHSEKIPRKIKLRIIGRKKSKKKIRELIQEYMISAVEDRGNFCPKCGGQAAYFRQYQVEYPEVWWEFRCLRDNTWVGGQDNSAYSTAIDDLIGE